MSVFRGASVYLVANVINAVIPLLLIPVLTRYLSMAEYGQLAIFQYVITCLCTISGMSVVGAANQKFYDDAVNKKCLKEFNGCCIQILMLTSFFSLIFVVIFQKNISQYLAIPESWLLSAVIISSLSFINGMRLGQWQIRNQVKWFGILQIGNGLLNMLLALLFVISLSQGSRGRIDAQLITTITIAIIALFWLYKDDLLHVFAWRPDFIKEALKFGIPLVPHAIGGLFINLYDRFFVNTTLGAEETAIYVVALQISSVFTIVFDAVNKSYVPWLFSKLKYEDHKLKIVKITYFLMLILMLVSIIPFLIAPFAIRLIAGEEYANASEIFGIVCLGQIFSGMYLLVTNFIFYAKKTKYLAFGTLLSGVVNVVLLFFLVEKYGLLGAALSFLIAKIVHFIITFSITIKISNMPWKM